MAVPIQSITFWLNAFVPRDLAGYTTTLSAGDFKGLTALTTGPSCYLTDQRAFSNNLRASSRMHSGVTVAFTDAAPTITQSHRCDDTIECDLVDGEIRCRRKASTSNMKLAMTASKPKMKILIRMDCKSANPCTANGEFNEIEYKGTIEIDAVARSIAIDLMICLFPAFEGYAAIDDGPATVLFRHSPPPGILALRIPQGANRCIRSQLRDGDTNGKFDSVSE